MTLVDEFKQKIITLLLSLLEGEQKQVIDNMTQQLDFYVIKDRLKNVFVAFARDLYKNPNINCPQINIKYLNSKLTIDSFSSNIIEGFQIFALLQALSEQNSVAKT